MACPRLPSPLSNSVPKFFVLTPSVDICNAGDSTASGFSDSTVVSPDVFSLIGSSGEIELSEAGFSTSPSQADGLTSRAPLLDLADAISAGRSDLAGRPIGGSTRLQHARMLHDSMVDKLKGLADRVQHLEQENAALRGSEERLRASNTRLRSKLLCLEEGAACRGKLLSLQDMIADCVRRELQEEGQVLEHEGAVARCCLSNIEYGGTARKLQEDIDMNEAESGIPNDVTDVRARRFGPPKGFIRSGAAMRKAGGSELDGNVNQTNASTRDVSLNSLTTKRCVKITLGRVHRGGA